jgi:hypothetical protein
MKCEYCENDSKEGSNYLFYYGKHVSTTMPVPGMRKYNFKLAGQKKAWICRSCVLKRFLFSRTGIVAILFTLSVVTLLFRPDIVRRIFHEDPDFIGVFGLIVFGFILMRHVMMNGSESISKFGDELAIRIYRSELEAAGNTSFFTRAQHKHLDAST